MSTDYSYLGVGKISLREVGSSAGLIEVGNARDLTISVNANELELPDFTSVGGGTFNSVDRIASVEMQFEMLELSPENIAKAMRGVASAIPTSAITNEAHTGYVGAFIPTNYPSTGTITVKGNAGATTHVLNTDYSRVPGGILVISGGGISDSDAITFDYTPDAGYEVQPMIAAAKEYEAFFSGLNEARSGKQVTVRVHRWKMSPAQQLQLIGTDYLGLPVGGKMLPDLSKNGTSISRYFAVQLTT